MTLFVCQPRPQPEDLDLLYSNGAVANDLLLTTKPRLTMFTGSQQVAEKLCADMKGKVTITISVAFSLSPPISLFSLSVSTATAGLVNTVL